MAEVPDRKVLKDVLARLKAKTISTEKHYHDLFDNTLALFNGILAATKDFERKLGAETGTITALTYLRSAFVDSHIGAISLVDDLKLYTESLEKYSAELDQAFWGAIEKQAKQIL